MWTDAAGEPPATMLSVGHGTPKAAESLAMLTLAEHNEPPDTGFLVRAQKEVINKTKFDLFLTLEYQIFQNAKRKKEEEIELSRLRRLKHKSVFRVRMLIAVAAGLALIAPMLIMTLHPSKITSLATASIFIVLVAVVLAYTMEDAQNKDIVGATAAYAAVLVVFVGTGTGTGSGGS